MSREPGASEGSRAAIAHCLAKIEEISAEENPPGPMRVLQLGYNLGRLSELTGLGREVCWDAWKPLVERWDQPAILALAEDLRHRLDRIQPDDHSRGG